MLPPAAPSQSVEPDDVPAAAPATPMTGTDDGTKRPTSIFPIFRTTRRTIDTWRIFLNETQMVSNTKSHFYHELCNSKMTTQKTCFIKSLQYDMVLKWRKMNALSRHDILRRNSSIKIYDVKPKIVTQRLCNGVISMRREKYLETN